jgi:hypothetical protein
MKFSHVLGAVLAASLCSLAAAGSAPAQTTQKKTLANVKGVDPAALAGMVCSGTFEVPSSRSNNSQGAFQFELSEVDGRLALRHSSKLGFVAYRDAINGQFNLENIGFAPTVEVDGRKIRFVTALGTKWDLTFEEGNTIAGTADPRGMRGREKWDVAQVSGACKTPKAPGAPLK